MFAVFVRLDVSRSDIPSSGHVRELDALVEFGGGVGRVAREADRDGAFADAAGHGGEFEVNDVAPVVHSGGFGDAA